MREKTTLLRTNSSVDGKLWATGYVTKKPSASFIGFWMFDERSALVYR